MFDIEAIIQGGGLLLIALIIFAESGMFVGFFLPGDTLLLTAGIFAAQGKLPIALTIVVIALAAIVGDNTGYHIGKRYGRKVFAKEDGIVFRKAYIDQAEKFYQRFGSRMMLLSHFVPVVRTFAPPVAGAAHMPYRKFFIYDAIGIIGWAVSITLLGYFVGTKIPDIDKYIHLALIAVVAITIGPTLYHIAKALRENRRKSEK